MGMELSSDGGSVTHHAGFCPRPVFWPGCGLAPPATGGQRKRESPGWTLIVVNIALGLLLLLPYLAAWWLSDLRQHTLEFEIIFFVAFLIYSGATILALHQERWSKAQLIMIFALAATMQGFLIFTPPTLSDDMYRYIWDG